MYIIMNKKLLIAIIAALLCIAAIGAYAVLDSIFPKAEPINILSEKDTMSALLIRNDKVTAMVKTEDLEVLLKNINTAKPTRKMSVNDYPSVKAYYILELHTSARFHRYFIYEENSQVYIEIPYEGIYKADSKILDLVSEYFQK